jgi:hypothetical protein
MELLFFVTSTFLLSNQYYYLFLIFLTSSIIFEWTIENDDKIFEDKLAMTLKNACFTVSKYSNKICQVSAYNYLNKKFLVVISIIKKSLSNKIEKIYFGTVMNNVENNYDKLLMSCLGNINTLIEPPSKYKDKNLNNVDDQIKKYISAFKKTS